MDHLEIRWLHSFAHVLARSKNLLSSHFRLELTLWCHTAIPLLGCFLRIRYFLHGHWVFRNILILYCCSYSFCSYHRRWLYIMLHHAAICLVMWSWHNFFILFLLLEIGCCLICFNDFFIIFFVLSSLHRNKDFVHWFLLAKRVLNQFLFSVTFHLNCFLIHYVWSKIFLQTTLYLDIEACVFLSWLRFFFEFHCVWTVDWVVIITWILLLLFMWLPRILVQS